MGSGYRISKLLVILLVLALLATVFLGCSPEEAVDEETDDPTDEVDSKIGGRVVWARADGPTILDPQKHGEAAGSQVNALMGGNLVTRNPWTHDFEPLHAHTWDVSDDGLVYTFYLRDDIMWHSGRQLTAHDYVWTYERAFDPATASVQTIGFLEGITNYEALDDLTLELTLGEPSAVFLANVSSSYTQPLDREYVEEKGDDYGRYPTGMGAWKFEEWITGESITLVRNEDYAWAEPWFDNQGPPYIEEIHFRYLPEEATLLAALEAGEIDIARVPAHAVDRFEDHPDFEVAVNLQMGMGRWFMPNISREIWQDHRVRQAVAHALADRDFFIETSLEGRAQPAYGPMSPPMMAYNERVEELAPQHDIERAETLLEEAGWTMGSDGIREKDGEKFEILLLTRTEELQMRDAEIAQALLEEVGIKVNIESFERALHTEKVAGGEHDLSIGQYWWSSGDPDVLYFFFHSSQAGGGLNHFQLVDPRVDDLLEKQRGAVDQDVRWRYVGDLQELLVEENYAFFIYITEEYSAINKNIKDWMVSPAGGIMLNDSWIE